MTADVAARESGGDSVRPRRERPVRRRHNTTPSLPQLLAAAVELAPTATAVTFDGRNVSYADLDVSSSRLARSLIDRGVGPEDLIAVGIPRSIESVTALWAVAKSGAGFVPVDPNYPPERVAHMVVDSGAKLGLTISTSRSTLPDVIEWLVLDDAAVAAETADRSAESVSYTERVRPLRNENPAYVIYTSGSTGLPKGVVVTHAGLSNFCDEQRERYGVTSASRTLHFA